MFTCICGKIGKSSYLSLLDWYDNNYCCATLINLSEFDYWIDLKHNGNVYAIYPTSKNIQLIDHKNEVSEIIYSNINLEENKDHNYYLEYLRNFLLNYCFY